MALCVYTNIKLDEQINLVEKLFKNVPKRENFEMPKYDLVKPYDENTLNNFYKIILVNNEDKNIFKWKFAFCPNYKV